MRGGGDLSGGECWDPGAGGRASSGEGPHLSFQ